VDLLRQIDNKSTTNPQQIEVMEHKQCAAALGLCPAIHIVRYQSLICSDLGGTLNWLVQQLAHGWLWTSTDEDVDCGLDTWCTWRLRFVSSSVLQTRKRWLTDWRELVDYIRYNTIHLRVPRGWRLASFVDHTEPQQRTNEKNKSQQTVVRTGNPVRY